MAARAASATQHEPRGRHRPSSSSSSGGGGRGLSKTASGNNLTVSGSNSNTNSGSAQSLVYWSHSKDEHELDDAIQGFTFGEREDEDYEVGSQSSLSDSSLYYSEDDASRRSQITGVVSLVSSSSGADRYFDQHEQDDDAFSLGEVSNTNSSTGANVYIFTDDDSLSPRDHRLAANESRRLVFRSADEFLNPPSLLETPGFLSSVGSTPDVSPMRMSPMLDTPSGIVSPSSWQQYNQRRGKQVARRMLFDASQHHQNQDQGPSNLSSSSSPSRQSLWSRVARSGPARSHQGDGNRMSKLTQGGNPKREGRANPSDTNAHRRLSLVGSWEEDEEGGDDDDDDDGSVRILHVHEGGGVGWDVRADARDIVHRLDLGDDGHQVLDEIEAALDGTGAVKDAANAAVHRPPFPSSRALIPFWPIRNGTMWLPRYDLYVEQALRSSLSLLAA